MAIHAGSLAVGTLLLTLSCQSSRPTSSWSAAPALAASAQSPAPTRPQEDPSRKTDVLVFKNGDQVTGEIKELSRGKLKLSTSGMDTVYIKWDDLARITSRYRYRVELSGGAVYVGSFRTSDQDGILVVGAGADTTRIEWYRVVWINQVEDEFRERFTGYINTGFSYTKASDVAQLTFGGKLRYDTEDFFFNLKADAIVTTQESRGSTSRSNVGLSFVHYLGSRWFAGIGVSTEQNDELGIDRRTAITAGAGRYLIQTNSVLWGVTTGLSGNEEVGADPGIQKNLEGVLSTEFLFFRYETPKSNWSLNLDAYPSLNETGRWRIDFNTRVRQEIVSDFFLDLNFYVNYDSDPPSATAQNTDYGVVTSLGYSF